MRKAFVRFIFGALIFVALIVSVSAGAALAQDSRDEMKMNMPRRAANDARDDWIGRDDSSMESLSMIESVLHHATSGTDAEPNSTPVSMLMIAGHWTLSYTPPPIRPPRRSAPAPIGTAFCHRPDPPPRLAELLWRQSRRRRTGRGDHSEGHVDCCHHIGRACLRLAHAPVAAGPVVPLTFAGFIAALVAALWAYDGWNNVSMVSSEIRNPQRNLPLALIGGTTAVIAIYLLANWAYFHVLTAGEVSGADRVASEMMRKIFGSTGGNAVAIAALISIFAALNGSILSGSRVPYAAARRGIFLPRHRKSQSEIPYACRFHLGLKHMGVRSRSVRQVRRSL